MVKLLLVKSIFKNAFVFFNAKMNNVFSYIMKRTSYIQ